MGYINSFYPQEELIKRKQTDEYVQRLTQIKEI
jgi:hypothetical protein